MGAISRRTGGRILAGGFYERRRAESITRALMFPARCDRRRKPRPPGALCSGQLSLDPTSKRRAAACCLAVTVAARGGSLHGADVVATRRAFLADDLGYARH